MGGAFGVDRAFGFSRNKARAGPDSWTMAQGLAYSHGFRVPVPGGEELPDPKAVWMIEDAIEKCAQFISHNAESKTEAVWELTQLARSPR